MTAPDRRFEVLIEPHLDAAYNLARWLCRDAGEAEDLVQDACLRALRHADGYRGGDARAWLLKIVRNVCYDALRRRDDRVREYDDDLDSLHLQEAGELPALANDPQLKLLREADARQLEAALLKLPGEFREVIVLRELEELAYKQIADVLGVPIGTVMSRLSRARQQLRVLLTAGDVR